MRRSLEVLLLLIVLGLAVRSFVRPAPLIHSFHLADQGCYGFPSSYRFDAEADGSALRWRVVGKIQFTEDWPDNRPFVEFVPETEIYRIAQAVIGRAKQQHQSRWQSRRYEIATEPADKVVHYFSGQYKDAEFKVESTHEFTVRSDRKTLERIATDLAYLESLPFRPPP